jgi:hypothetical protein
VKNGAACVRSGLLRHGKKNRLPLALADAVGLVCETRSTLNTVKGKLKIGWILNLKIIKVKLYVRAKKKC